NDRDDGGPTEKERADHGGRADDADDDAGRVQGVDQMGEPDERAVGLSGDDVHGACAFRNARSKPGSARTIVSRSTVSQMRMWPGTPKPEPGTVRTPSSASRRTNATSSSIGVRGNTYNAPFGCPHR